MFFFFSKLLGGLTDPGTLLGVIIVGGGLAAVLQWQRLALILQFAAVAIILLFSIGSAATWLAAPMEARFPAHPALPGHVAGIIVLGGTERIEQSAFWRQPTLSDPAPIAAMLKLAQRYPEAKLVFSGGGHARLDPTIGEASIVHDFVAELGGDPNKIIYETRSRNTYENAVFSAAKLHPAKDETWILVCQAIGMPRAVGVFRRSGWKIIPYPAGYLSAGKGGGFQPSSLGASLALAEIATHEWVGLVIYRLMGYTDAFYPH